MPKLEARGHRADGRCAEQASATPPTTPGRFRPNIALASINPGKLAYPVCGGARRPLCRLRSADRARKHHDAAKDRAPRRPAATAERTQHRDEEEAKRSARSCAISAQRPRRSRRSRQCSAPRGRDGELKEGQKIRVLLSPVRGGQRLQPVRVIAGRRNRDRGGRRPVRSRQIRRRRRRRAPRPTRTPPKTTTMRMTAPACGSIKASMKPRCATRCRKTVIEELIRVYSYDVDFQRKAKPGNSFEVLYAGEEENMRRQVRRDVRLAHRRRRDQEVLSFHHPRRRHRRLLRRDRQERQEVPGPQAGDRRHHALGIRIAARSRSSATPRCTPASIGRRRWARRSMPSGNGTLEKAGWESGYGKYIRIKHMPTAMRPPMAT